MMKIDDRSKAVIVRWRDFNKFKQFLEAKKTILIGGCFDTFHFGHLAFLKQAKRQGDYLIIALESDKFIINKKNKSPVHNQWQRAQILSALRMVDLIILLPYFKQDRNYDNLVTQIKPKIIAVASQDNNINNKRRQATAVGAQFVIVIKRLKQFASSKIRF